MKDKYILDSSIWIEIERGNEAIREKTLPFIQQNQVCLVDVIVAELLRGTHAQTDFDRLHAAFSNFVQLQTSWDKVAQFGFDVAKAGFYPPLVDLYIAHCAIDHGKSVITQDKHFMQISKVRSFEVVLLK